MRDLHLLYYIRAPYLQNIGDCALQVMVRTLEWTLHADDARDAAGDVDTEFQLKPEFHIRIASKWLQSSLDELDH